MFGRRTAIILGAGASYCYEDGISNVPIQPDIIGRLFFDASTSSGHGFPSFSGPTGLMHSFQLGEYMRNKFNIPEEPSKQQAKMDFWIELQQRGYTLETLHEELERELPRREFWLIEDFEAIIRTAVSTPMRERELSHVCRYHKKIAESLEPSDYIVNFNWDSLMADALLHYSHFWFPATGFRLNVFPMLYPCQKSARTGSLVHLFHPHGSVLLYESETRREDVPELIFLGPRQWNQGTGILSLYGIDLPDTRAGIVKPTKNPSEKDERKLSLGYMHLNDQWFKPIFVSPSKYKAKKQQWFSRIMLRNIHTLLPSTEVIPIIGYSFPPADIDHLKKMFASTILDSKTLLKIVNPSNDDENFRRRVEKIFPTLSNRSYKVKDFKHLCNEILKVGPFPPGY